jgi:hypothetical protein
MSEYALGMDVDGVFGDFSQHILDYARERGTEFPSQKSEITSWNISENFSEVFDQVKHDPAWWLTMPANPCTLPFPSELRVKCYITHRPVASSITRGWLIATGFPDAPVVTVDKTSDKAVIARYFQLTHFVDDKPSTCHEMNERGIKGILYCEPSNRHEREGLTCIHSFVQLYDMLGVCDKC